MACVEINPVYRCLLERHGLTTAGGLLGLEGVIVSGHPDRHVVRVSLGPVPAFLKREHRVRWKDRLGNAWAGFGWVSKSRREAVVLRELRRAGIGSPEWIAAGEDGHGRAFLVVRELEGAIELRTFLHRRPGAAPRQRLRFASGLGRALARLHATGFDHPDLYSKHVLVQGGGEAVAFLDCQRCVRPRRLGWAKRTRCLAALDASLGADLADGKERLACLRAYWRASTVADGHCQVQIGGEVRPRRCDRLSGGQEKPGISMLLRRIRRQTGRLLRRARIRELRHAPLAEGEQNLIWLDGEALCVTRQFRDRMAGRVPAWLLASGQAAGPPGGATEAAVPLPGSGHGTLVRRLASRPWWWLWCRLRRRPPTTPELEQAGILFRLQRHGIGTPRLLAVGQRARRPWQMESFLLTETPAGCTSLTAWLQSRPADGSAAARHAARRHVVRAAADVLRQLHDANHYLAWGEEDGSCPLLVQGEGREPPRVLLGSVARVSRRARPSRSLARGDLAQAGAMLARAGCSRGERLRFLLRYHRAAGLTAASKRLLRPSAGLVGR